MQRWSPRSFQRWYSGPPRLPAVEAGGGEGGGEGSVEGESEGESAGEGEGEAGGEGKDDAGAEGEGEGEGGGEDGGGGGEGAPLEALAAAVDVGGGHCAWRRRRRAPARVYYGCLSQAWARHGHGMGTAYAWAWDAHGMCMGMART